MQVPDHAKAVRNILVYTARHRLDELGAQLAKATNRLVQSGPFKNMVLPADSSWGDGDLTPKLLGAYEAELHGVLERAIARQPDLVVNVGCAEGFYAVGLARRLPDARVHAFDINEAAQKVCASAAAENGVGDRVEVHGRCGPEDLVKLVGGAKRALLVIDCEGFELDLLSEEAVPALGHCDLIVECHDFANRTITPTLKARFDATHELDFIREGARDPASFPQLRNLGSLDRLLCVCEFRPEVMYWMAAFPREA